MSTIQRRQNRSGTSWRVVFRDADKRQRVRNFDSEETAAQWKAVLDAVGPGKALQLLDEELPVDSRTVAEHVLRHIDHLTGVTEGTKKTYRSSVHRDMVDIGRLPLAALSREAVAKWVNRLAAAGLSGKSVANRHGLLSAALAAAVVDGLVPANPCRGIRLPRTDTEEMVFLTPPEYERIHYLLAEHWRPLALTLVGTGMRFGEATALFVGHVNLTDHSIRISQAWKYTGTRTPELGPPKTRRARRTVTMQPQLVEALQPLVAGRRPTELLFTNTRGDMVKQPVFWRAWRKAVAQFAGDSIDRNGKILVLGDGKHPRVHDLRHTFASWCIAANIPLPAIQRALGHESITTTIDNYGHLARADFDALATATAANLPLSPPAAQVTE